MPLAVGFASGIALQTGTSVTPALVAAAFLALSPPIAPLGFAAAGFAASTLARPGRQGGPAPGPREVRVSGRISSVPDRAGDRARFVLRDRAGHLLSATTRQLAWPLAVGDEISFDARIRTPERRRNPGGRDRAEDLAARGIELEAIGTSPPVRIASPSPASLVEAARDRFARLADATLPARQAGLVRAISTGDRSGVDPDTADAFARGGLAHLLSVSGLHLAVVALGAHRVARWLLSRCEPFVVRWDPRRSAAVASLPLAGLYALATGAQVPVVRSAIGAAVAFAAVLLDREVGALDALALAAIAVLAVDPGALRDVSFQLSFASVAGLALWSGPLRRALPVAPDRSTRRGRALEAVLTAACASAAATLATAPIVALHFRRISVAGVLSNVVGVPVGSALTIGGAIAAVASAVWTPLATWLLRACGPIAQLLLAITDAAAAPAWAAPGVGSPGLAGAATCYAGALLAWRWSGPRRVAAAGIAALALLAPPHVRHALAVHRGGLEVTFLSVGQGDATALLLPDGTAVLVDGGGEAQGSYDPGARDVVPWLRDAGVTRIAAVFLSHPHPDHLLGLPAVAAAFPVERFFTNGRRGDDATATALERLPRAEVVAAGARFERAGVRFEVLAPAGDHSAWMENDASLVLRVSYGSAVFLLCGDVEAEGEQRLVEAAGRERLRAAVVKIPHHGSATSSGPALVAATGAAYAIASVGHDNRFGFPDPAVVDRWRAAGAEVLRTDAGAVRFLTDGRSLRRTAASASLDALALARERL